LKFGEKERERQEGSVLSLTCAGDALWRPESVREEVAVGTVHGGQANNGGDGHRN
jgi:hypothetical protein